MSGISNNFFLELQLASMAENNTITDTRKKLNRIVEIYKASDYYEEDLLRAADLRSLSPETFRKADAFFIDEDESVAMLPKELRHDSLGFCKKGFPIFSGRIVYPVKDVKGDVMGWCGYANDSDVKYLDSVNYGYKAGNYSFYGMEKMEEYYRSDEPVFIPEGIVCTLYLRQEGFQSLCSLGSYISPYMGEIIRRLGHRAIMINDSDEAGNKCRKQVRYIDKSIRCIQSKISKDLDDSRKVDKNIKDELLKIKSSRFYRSPLFV